MIQGYYINLKERKHKKKKTEKLLRKLNLNNIERFDAIKDCPGLVGCYKSHIACLENAKNNGYNRCVIFEDDITCKNIEYTKKYINDIYFDDKLNYDVFMIGCWYYNNLCYKEEEEYFKIHKAVCLHAYIVDNKYYDTLINHLKEGLKLYQDNNYDKKYNNDEYIGMLQMKDNWYGPKKVLISQEDGFSDNFNEVRCYKTTIYKIPVK
jgi:GR25 family glycosyltransferase involved in LPS biosynthesis